MSQSKRLTDLIPDLVFSSIGILTAGFALRSFLVPNAFLDGGVTGISLLLHELYGWHLAIVILVANIPFIVMGGFLVNRKFAIRMLLCIIALAFCLYFIPYPVVTADKLLVSVFGGFFLGLGIGIAMRSGSALDGIEVLALFTLRRSSFTISEIILGLNVIIFLIAALHFGLETALYSMLTYFVATRTIDYVIEGLEAYTGVTIISGKSEQIKEQLALRLGRGITIYKGERGYLKESFDKHEACDIVFTVITRLEVRKLKNVVSEIDPKAFVFTNTIKEVAGGVLKRHVSH